MREYASAREHLDEVIALVEKLLERHHRLTRSRDADEAELRGLGELDVAVVRQAELVAARVELTSPERLPIERVRRAFDLTPTEMQTLLVLCALETSTSVRRAAGELLAGRAANAMIELVEAIAYAAPEVRDRSAIELAPDGSLFRYRLAMLGDMQAPWLSRAIRVAPRVLELAMGRMRLDTEVASVATLVDEPGTGDDLIVDDRVRGLVHEAVTRGAIPYVVGPRGSGRATLALTTAAALGLRGLVVRGAALPRERDALVEALQAICREATLFDALIVVRDLHLVELVATVASVLPSYGGPIVFAGDRMVWPPGAALPVVVAELGVPKEADRVTLWSRELDDLEVATRAAERYRITGGLITGAAQAARQRADARGEPIALDDIRAGVRAQLDDELSQLAKRVEWKQTWDDLVLSDDIVNELYEMVIRIRHRRRVLDDWGFERKIGKGLGVSALFSGPPGTGKTMVAGLIAAELELDLYQIDVSRMMSKWLGETEKNLSRLFDAAASGHAVLLFDEADSLFAKRTEVKSSNDRYANLEVNYLLQRMESFDGVAILTTNHETAVDDAFQRRLAFRVRFPLPELEERARLWRVMVPEQAETSTNIDFKLLAQRFEMSGGYIRNAVLRAAYLAAADDTPIGMAHLHRAATLEYAAMGMIVHGL